MRVGVECFPSRVCCHTALTVIIGLWCQSVVVAQIESMPLPPLPIAQPAESNTEPEEQTGSMVFPDGFPTFAPGTASEADGTDSRLAPESEYPELLPPTSDFAPYGYEPDDEDDVPGMPDYEPEYVPPIAPLPDYFYEPEYYYAEGEIGPRPLADYAPPGYEARDYQDAPGVPEFTPLTPPPRPSREAAPGLVTRGIVPGSFLVPGTNTSFRLRGFVRLAALYDFDPIGSTDSFVTNTIPVPQQDGQNFNMSGRISRFALESWTPTSFHEWNVHTFIEGDFFNGPAQAVGGGGNPFRLRHAFFDFGYFRFGQQNSVFMDGSNWPSLVDFQGPNSWVNQRQPSARVTLPLGDTCFWAASIERCFSDITTNGLGTNVQDVPDFATHLRFEGTRGHAQVATVLRTIGFRPTGDEDVDRELAVGLTGSVVVHPWAVMMGTDPVREANPSGLTRSRILLMCAGGPGIGRYINDLAGQGFDGQVDPITGDLNLVDALGWNASYEHWYSETWLSNFTFANVLVDNTHNQPGTTYDEAKYLAASLWWLPVPRMSFGIEYMWGQRENLNGQDADANRLHGLFQYNF
jgi:hypothetical protein